MCPVVWWWVLPISETYGRQKMSRQYSASNEAAFAMRVWNARDKNNTIGFDLIPRNQSVKDNKIGRMIIWYRSIDGWPCALPMWSLFPPVIKLLQLSL